MRREVYACDSSCKRGGGGGLVPCPACPTNRIVLLSIRSKLQRTRPPPGLQLEPTARMSARPRASLLLGTASLLARKIAVSFPQSAQSRQQRVRQPRPAGMSENRLRKLPAICAVTATAILRRTDPPSKYTLNSTLFFPKLQYIYIYRNSRRPPPRSRMYASSPRHRAAA